MVGIIVGVDQEFSRVLLNSVSTLSVDCMYLAQRGRRREGRHGPSHFCVADSN